MVVVIGIYQVLGVIVGIFVLYLLIVALVPGISVPEQRLQTAIRAANQVGAEPTGSRRDVTFEVKGTSLSAWLYLPQDLSTPVPCIVIGHGFGGTRDMGLESYAIRYQEAGFAALVFDYRHFGDSGGEPRQLVWIPHQLEDYSAAVDCARALEEIDPARIALWGTSLSGGHVIVIAARDENIVCVVAQCPGLDGRAAAAMGFKRAGIGYGLRMIMHGQRDLVRSWFGLSPHKLPIVGESGSLALLSGSNAHDAFRKLAPEGFSNEVCARITIRGDKYRPVKKARRVRCPVLLQICDLDELTPISAAEETANRLGNYVEVKHYPIGHFDIYFGEHFERSVRDQLEFFKKHLALRNV